MTKPPETLGRLLLTQIRPSPTNPRKSFPEESLRELADSIAAHGVLQDVLVRPVAAAGKQVRFDGERWQGVSHYEIVAGERRWRAAKLAGLRDIGAKVTVLTDAEVLEVQLVENDQREDVKPTERAAAYKRLADAVGVGVAAERLGLPAGTVRGWCLLAKAPPELAAALDAGTVGRSVAERVCRVPGEAAREIAALLVLIGATHYRPGEDTAENLRAELSGLKPDETRLTDRETKELIARHFTRELGKAPFDRKKPLPLLADVPSCEECPKRAGNLAKADPEFAGVRADVCTDTDCYGQKYEAYKTAERQKFAKRWKIAELDDVDADGDPFSFDRQTLVAGWLDWNAPALEGELHIHGSPTAWVKQPKRDVTVGELVLACASIHGCRPMLAFDGKGKPQTVIHTADARKTLIAAGIMRKAERPGAKQASRPVAALPEQTTRPEDDGPYKLYRVTINPDVFPAVEFDAADGTSPDDLREQAASAFMDWFDGIDWSDAKLIPRPFVDFERVPDAEAADPSPAKGEERVPATPAADIDERADSLALEGEYLGDLVGHGETVEQLLKKIETAYICDKFVKEPKEPIPVKPFALRGDANLYVNDGGIYHRGHRQIDALKLFRPDDFKAKYPAREPRLGPRFSDKMTDDERANAYWGVRVRVGKQEYLLGREEDVRKLTTKKPESRAPAPPPGPVVCKPLGELVLAGIDGLTHEDLQCLSAVGVRTLGELERRCNALDPDDRPATVECQIYTVLSGYKGAFSPADAERITDAIVAHLNLAKPQAKAVSPALTTIPQLTPSQAQFLAAYGLKTVADVAAACEDVRRGKRRPASVGDPAIDGGIYSWLRDKVGEHPKQAVLINAAGDALLDWVGHEAARRQLAESPPAATPAKGKKRKAVTA